MTELIEKEEFMTDKYPSRWLAVKYVEEDENIQLKGKENVNTHDKLVEIVKRLAKHTDKTLNTYPEAIIADYRYGYIQSLLKQGVGSREYTYKPDLSEKIDKVVTQRMLGPLIMLGILYLLFRFTFQLGAYPQGWVEDGFSYLGHLGNYIYQQ